LAPLPGLLFCSIEPFPGGSTAAQKLGAYLPALMNHFSVVVAAGQGSSSTVSEVQQGARVQRVAMGSGDLRSRIELFERAIKRLLETEQPAIVHLMDPFSGYSVFQQKPRFSFKVVFDGQALASTELLARRKDLTPGSEAVEKIVKRERFCLSHADRVLTTTAGAPALEVLGARRERLRPAPNGWAGDRVRAVYRELLGLTAPPPDDTLAALPPASLGETMKVDGVLDRPWDVSEEVTMLDVRLPSETLDPWFAQLTHGYCPPENSEFARPPPATNFPGREQTPPPLKPRKP
jgi:hypothetical protein